MFEVILFFSSSLRSIVLEYIYSSFSKLDSLRTLFSIIKRSILQKDSVNSIWLQSVCIGSVLSLFVLLSVFVHKNEYCCVYRCVWVGVNVRACVYIACVCVCICECACVFIVFVCVLLLKARWSKHLRYWSVPNLNQMVLKMKLILK